MGNGPAGQRLGSSTGQTSSSNVAEELLIRVNNQTGLELRRSHIDPPRFIEELPERIGSSIVITLSNLQDCSGEVFLNYISDVPFRQTNRQETRLDAGSQLGRPAMSSLDCRDSRINQILTICLVLQSGWSNYLLGQNGVVVSATFGSSPDNADTLRRTVGRMGSSGVCSWKILPASEKNFSPNRLEVEILLARTENALLKQRGNLLDNLQAVNSSMCSKRRTPQTSSVAESLNQSVVASEKSPTERLAKDSSRTHTPDAEENMTTATSITKCDLQQQDGQSSLHLISGPAKDLTSDAQALDQQMSLQHVHQVDSPHAVSPELSSQPRTLPPEKQDSNANSTQEPCQQPTLSTSSGVPKRTRSGALALQAQRALEKIREAEAQRLRLLEEERLLKADSANVIIAQDLEYQIGLLHDQLRDLRKERDCLASALDTLRPTLESAIKAKEHSEFRLARYGKNPRIRAELDKALETEADYQERVAEIEDALSEISTAIAEKEEMLALASCAED